MNELPAQPPEIRFDRWRDRYVCFAPARAQRPHVLDGTAVKGPTIQELIDRDPFLEGREHETARETYAIRKEGTLPGEPGWLVRCIENRYPALAPEEPPPDESFRPHEDKWFRSMPGVGVHEVVVECPHFETHLSHLPVEQIVRVITAWRDRLKQIRNECRFDYGVIFKNQGAAAGASLPHCHSQIMALPFVPPDLEDQYSDKRGKWLLEHEVDRARSDGRIVTETDFLTVFCPYASAFAFETWFAPKTVECGFCEIADGMIQDLAQTLKTLLLRLEVVAGDPAYNLVVQTVPWSLNRSQYAGDRIIAGESRPIYLPWHIEILPRMSGVAGFEWATGGFINAVFPETAAALLRGKTTGS